MKLTKDVRLVFTVNVRLTVGSLLILLALLSGCFPFYLNTIFGPGRGKIVERGRLGVAGCFVFSHVFNIFS